MFSSTPDPKMERLTSTIFPKEFPEDPAKRFYLCSCDSWESLRDKIHASSKYFGLLTVANASKVSNETVAAAAKLAIEMGLACLCTWGPDCERVHDIFDEVDVAYELDGRRDTGWGKDDVLMTTWHSNDSLGEAIGYFVYCAFPTDYFCPDCNDWIVAVIGNEDWEKEVRTEFSRIVAEARKYRNSKK